jgi:3-phenylpropionate/trans-cinnamate dioxygenase ferredoxin reductase subunit
MTSKAMVVIGAGMCGGNAAVTLREEGYAERVLLVGDEPGVPFGRPPLSKTYLRGEEDLGGWLVRPPDWYAGNGVEPLTGRATSIDAAQHEVLLDSGERVSYDRLLIATGGHNRRLDVPGTDLPGVLSLRTVSDCDTIRHLARPGRRAVIVGMGFIGAEVAASLRQLDVDVSAVLSGCGPLSQVLGDTVASVLAAVHREKGVDLVTDDRVVGFSGDGHVEYALTSQGRRLACDFAVVGVGIEPAVEILERSGIATGNGVLVDDKCRTSVAGVYAAGDVANHLHPVFGRLRVEHYNNAERHGRAAARSMLGSGEPFADIHTFWSDQYEHKIEYVGHARRWDEFVVRGSITERAFLGFYVEKRTVRAVMGLNRGGDPEADQDDELFACKALVQKGIQVGPALLADEKVDLRDLAAAPA